MVKAQDLVGEVRTNATELAEAFAETLVNPRRQITLTPAVPPVTDDVSDEVRDHHARKMIGAAASILMAAEAVTASGIPIVLAFDPDRPAWIVARLVDPEAEATS